MTVGCGPSEVPADGTTWRGGPYCCEVEKFIFFGIVKQKKLKLTLRERLNSGVLQAGNPGACGISPKSSGLKTELKFCFN